ncbi:MAG: hypothetical protein Q3982_02380 [Phoenicibacter congonensis]|uniref:Uncharacterized protein n=1 Tax=Phoenicibacter congonensis TaxID=1944646 RepID=A0AA43RGP0_9ACTN|nr:hypothetical protein [Phoenicibacter congonensis]
MDITYPATGKCCFCDGEYINGGHSPVPIVDAGATSFRCCDKCYLEDVVPAMLYRNTDAYKTEVHKREQRVRRKLSSQGLQLKKSRTQNLSVNDYGGYQVINAYSNTIEAGEKFDMSLEDVEDFSNED